MVKLYIFLPLNKQSDFLSDLFEKVFTTETLQLFRLVKYRFDVSVVYGPITAPFAQVRSDMVKLHLQALTAE